MLRHLGISFSFHSPWFIFKNEKYSFLWTILFFMDTYFLWTSDFDKTCLWKMYFLWNCRFHEQCMFFHWNLYISWKFVFLMKVYISSENTCFMNNLFFMIIILLDGTPIVHQRLIFPMDIFSFCLLILSFALGVSSTNSRWAVSWRP